MHKIHTGDLIYEMRRTYGRFLKSDDVSRTVVLGLLTKIHNHLVSGRDVQLDNLGVLHVTSRKARDTNFGRPNLKAGQIVKGVTFRDGSALKRVMNR